jgi:hypothetical protein
MLLHMVLVLVSGARGGDDFDQPTVRPPEPIRAVTSISIRIRGSASPAEIIIAAGRTSPK